MISSLSTLLASTPRFASHVSLLQSFCPSFGLQPATLFITPRLVPAVPSTWQIQFNVHQRLSSCHPCDTSHPCAAGLRFTGSAALLWPGNPLPGAVTPADYSPLPSLALKDVPKCSSTFLPLSHHPQWSSEMTTMQPWQPNVEDGRSSVRMHPSMTVGRKAILSFCLLPRTVA